MTREEAIKLLRKLRETIDRNNAYGEAEEMGIQALEQEPCDVFDKYGNYKYPSDVELTEPNTATSMPCEDTISRQAVLDIDFKRIILTTAKPAEMIEQKVKSLPSVTPQLKTEKVIKMRDATPEERESIAKYIKSISKPTAIEFDEEQEQLDFVQPHKEPRQDLQQAAERIIKQQNKWFEEQERKEQEPCEDAISRQAVMDDLCDGCELYKNGEQTCFTKCEEYHFLATLPPVTPQPKDGKWIDHRDDGFVECPFCGHATNCEDNIDELHYCFYCGAKMVEPQERSEDAT